jgi:hypothetical protein
MEAHQIELPNIHNLTGYDLIISDLSNYNNMSVINDPSLRLKASDRSFNNGIINQHSEVEDDCCFFYASLVNRGKDITVKVIPEDVNTTHTITESFVDSILKHIDINHPSTLILQKYFAEALAEKISNDNIYILYPYNPASVSNSALMTKTFIQCIND